MNNLGSLIPVELHDMWINENSDFTPWLTHEESLAILVETLGIDLDLKAQEKAVGPFRADTLCKNEVDPLCLASHASIDRRNKPTGGWIGSRGGAKKAWRRLIRAS